MSSITYDLATHGKETSSFSRKYIEYWLTLTQDEPLPSQSQFNLHEIYKYVPYFMMYEVISRDLIVIKQAGTEIVRRYGKEITGKNYLDFRRPELRERAYNSFSSMINHPVGLHATLNHETQKHQFFAGESIGFPFVSSSGNPNHVVFMSYLTAELPHLHDEGGSVQYINVPERLYIDIGAGVPDALPE